MITQAASAGQRPSESFIQHVERDKMILVASRGQRSTIFNNLTSIMKLKTLSLIAAAGALLLIGAGCVGKGPITQVKPPGAEVAAPAGDKVAAPASDIDKSVDDILKSEDGTAASLSDEAADSADISADQADVNSIQDSSYEAQ